MTLWHKAAARAVAGLLEHGAGLGRCASWVARDLRASFASPACVRMLPTVHSSFCPGVFASRVPTPLQQHANLALASNASSLDLTQNCTAGP